MLALAFCVSQAAFAQVISDARGEADNAFQSIREVVSPGFNLGTTFYQGKIDLSQDLIDGAKIQVTVADEVTGSVIPSKIKFFTGLDTLSNRFTISEKGRIGIWDENPGSKLSLIHFADVDPSTNSIMNVLGGRQNTPKRFEVSNNPETQRLLGVFEGDFSIFDGNLTVRDGSITASNGTIFADRGLTIRNGDLNIMEGSIIVDKGDYTAKEGKIVVQNNDVVVETGNMKVNFGKLFVNIGDTGMEDEALKGNHVAYINGGLLATNVVVDDFSNWPDYVFDRQYPLLPLQELAKYIHQHQHLPEVPSAKAIEENGVNLAEMQATLLKKIEELTLYILDQQAEIDALKKEVAALQGEK